jgi:acyl carrier protein
VNNSEILEKLTDIFHDVFSDDSLVLAPQMTADDVEEWDSFNHINIVVATETRFGIKFKTAEIEKLKNVGEFVELISQKLNHK